MGCGGGLELPPGFRFHPTDDELVLHYLCRKCAAQPIAVPIIAEVDLYKYDPWDLPGKAVYGENEWYFFSPRERKYPNGSRPNRAAGSGYWKATGADKPVGSPRAVGIKKALVFYAGKAPRGEKSNWIMHEYRLADVDRSARKKNSLKLDDWVLCRIYNKKGSTEPHYAAAAGGLKAGAASSPLRGPPRPPPLLQPKPELMGANSPATEAEQQVSEFLCFDSDSVPRLYAESSCSEHVLPPSPEFACDREVQSQPRWRDWDPAAAAAAGFPPLDGGGPFGQLFPGVFDPLQDLFMYLQKPF